MFAKASLRRLLTNAIYVGRVEHRGAVYAGEHEGIVKPEVWEEVNADLRSPDRGRERPYQRQSAMLSGDPPVRGVSKTDVADLHGQRQSAIPILRLQRRSAQGWNACPTKSVSARLIEDAVVTHLRVALENEKTRENLGVPAIDWLSSKNEPTDSFVQAVTRSVTFDAMAGEVSLEFQEFRKDDCNEC